MKKIMMIIMAVALVALPTMAQKFKEHDQKSVQFQSTSTMAPVNSQYSSQPMLNEDGTAYNPSTTPAAKAGGVPRKSGLFPDAPSTEGEQGNTPVGDAVLPLTLMALALAMFVYFRRKQTLKS